MATVTTKLTLSSTDLTTDTLDVALTDSLTIAGPTQSFRVATSTSSASVLAAADYTKSYVMFHNTSTDGAEIITIEKADSGDEYITLGAGEWCWFPWASTVDLFADAASGTPVLSVMVMQVAA